MPISEIIGKLDSNIFIGLREWIVRSIDLLLVRLHDRGADFAVWRLQ
jgi:hypothetical protein